MSAATGARPTGGGDDPGGLRGLTGDAVGEELLRRSLRAVVEQQRGTPLADEISQVLAGRRDIRDLATDDDFHAFTDQGMRDLDATWQQMDPEQKRQAIEQGQAVEAGLAADLEQRTSG